MNKLFELFEAERPVIKDSNAVYDIGYNNGLCMAQAIVLKRDVVEVTRCKDCTNTCDGNTGLICLVWGAGTSPNGWCYKAERKDNV